MKTYTELSEQIKLNPTFETWGDIQETHVDGNISYDEFKQLNTELSETGFFSVGRVIDIETTRNNMEEEGLSSEAIVSPNLSLLLQRQLLQQFLEEADMTRLIATSSTL
jgi:hypothetical protein